MAGNDKIFDVERLCGIGVWGRAALGDGEVENLGECVGGTAKAQG